MATLYGANATKIAAMKPYDILSAGSTGGKVRSFEDTYTGLGTESASDLITMGPALPVGARVLDVILATNAMGGTVDVGDADDDNRYQATSADNAVTHTDEKTGVLYTITGTDDTQIYVKISAAVTAAGTIKVICLYVVE